MTVAGALTLHVAGPDRNKAQRYMLGGLLALVSAVSFAYSNATVRRGVLSGTVLQAVGISLPIALPVFVAAMLLSGGFKALASFDLQS